MIAALLLNKEYVFHAINSHDQLVDTIAEQEKVISELHKQLQSAYDLLLISGWDDDFAADIREITNALSKQSKGE